MNRMRHQGLGLLLVAAACGASTSCTRSVEGVPIMPGAEDVDTSRHLGLVCLGYNVEREIEEVIEYYAETMGGEWAVWDPWPDPEQVTSYASAEYLSADETRRCRFSVTELPDSRCVVFISIDLNDGPGPAREEEEDENEHYLRMVELARTARAQGLHFLYVRVCGNLEQEEREKKYDAPLAAALAAAGVGEVTGGGPEPTDGNGRVRFCGIEVKVGNRDKGIAVLLETLRKLGAPRGSAVTEYIPVVRRHRVHPIE